MLKTLLENLSKKKMRNSCQDFQERAHKLQIKKEERKSKLKKKIEKIKAFLKLIKITVNKLLVF